MYQRVHMCAPVLVHECVLASNGECELQRQQLGHVEGEFYQRRAEEGVSPPKPAVHGRVQKPQTTTWRSIHCLE